MPRSTHTIVIPEVLWERASDLARLDRISVTKFAIQAINWEIEHRRSQDPQAAKVLDAMRAVREERKQNEESERQEETVPRDQE